MPGRLAMIRSMRGTIFAVRAHPRRITQFNGISSTDHDGGLRSHCPWLASGQSGNVDAHSKRPLMCSNHAMDVWRPWWWT